MPAPASPCCSSGPIYNSPSPPAAHPASFVYVGLDGVGCGAVGRRIVGQHTCMIGYSASAINSRLAQGAGRMGGFGASEADRFRALWGDAAAEPHQRAQSVRTSYITRPRPWSCSDHFWTADDLVAGPCRYNFFSKRDVVRACPQPPPSNASIILPPEFAVRQQRRLRGYPAQKNGVALYVSAPRLLPWNQTLSGLTPIRVGPRSVIIRRPWGRAQVPRLSAYHTGTYTTCF